MNVYAVTVLPEPGTPFKTTIESATPLRSGQVQTHAMLNLFKAEHPFINGCTVDYTIEIVRGEFAPYPTKVPKGKRRS